jgi:MoxR-like ATPase
MSEAMQSNPPLFPVPVSLDEATQLAAGLRREVQQAVVGQEAAIDQVVIGLLAAGHVLIEGVPGLGKTLLVLALARTFAGSFSRIQFTPDLMPSDVTGHALFDLKSQEFQVRKGPVFANLVLADEINRAPAKTQAALLEVMQENRVTIEGQGFELARPFMVLATQNPVEQEGTYPLPEAQLDRFLLKVQIEYPSAEDELRLVERVTAGQVGDALSVQAVSTITRQEALVAAQTLIAGTVVDPRITDYAVRLVRATRALPTLARGAGPRGAIALVRAGRAAAALAGRDFVIPDDIKAMALPALRHRVQLSPELEMEGRTTDEVLRALAQLVDAPRT